MEKKRKIGVLASGSGTNLQAIIDACETGEISADVAIVISNIRDAYCLTRACKYNVPALFVNHRDFQERESFEKRLIEELDRREVDLVCLAGFMRILTSYFVSHYKNRIMNIHPALLPAFARLYGAHIHEAVIASGAKFSGCTVHFVVPEVDLGPIILQTVVPVLDDDTPDSLAARVLVEEHRTYKKAVSLFFENRLRIDGNRVRILE